MDNFTNVVEHCHSSSEEVETKKSGDSNVIESKENVNHESGKESSTTKEEIFCEPQKETIEIIKVEVLPRREEHVKADEAKVEAEAMDNDDINKFNKNTFFKEEQSQSLRRHVLTDSAEDEVSMDNGNVVECYEESTQNNTVIEVHLHSNEMATDDKEITNNKPQESSTNTSEMSTIATTSGLDLLAQYGSDNDDKNSDTDSVVEVPISVAQDYRNQVVEIDSDTDSDDSSDSSDVEYLNELRKTIEKRIEVADEEDDEDDDDNEQGGKKKPKQRLKVKGEMLLEDLPPIQDLQITVPEDECIEFGKIHSIVDQLVLVTALPNSILLDLETVIFLEKGQKVLGEVFDVLGQVADPLYCVRFNSNKQIKEKNINVGDVVYVAPKTQYTQYVILSNLMKLKGSDASWENDIEPPPRFLDYSDDEQEQLAKRQLRNKDRPMDNDDLSKRPRTVDDEINSSTNKANYNNNQHNRRNNSNRGGYSGHYNNNPRQRHNGPQQQHQQQRGPNHHRNSWHSNYYPQSYQSPVNYGMPSVNSSQPHSAQQYPPHVPMYAMPPVAHNISYPPVQPTQYGAPPIMHQHAPQLMPNSFSIRPPTLHGPHHSYPQQYTSPPPPPPGSQ